MDKMMQEISFMEALHKSTKRDYTARVCKEDKVHCTEVSVQYGKDYWDGDRKYGYGGYHYDGRWLPIAEKMAEHYDLKEDAKILDVGCGKGFLLYEFTQVLPKAQVVGIDISSHAIENSKQEIKSFVQVGNATKLPYEDGYFDCVVSLGTLHNLYNFELFQALQEIERVGKENKYVMQESYRNEREKVNMLNWQLTQHSFYNVDEWNWFFKLAGYTGDFGFIFFE
jgi:SAM-dependent methyltransferase